MNWIYTLLFFFCAGASVAQSSIEWSTTIGGSGNEQVASILSSTDNHLIFSGSTASSDFDITSNQGQLDAFCSKLDEFGNLVWLKTYGGSQDDIIYNSIATTDGYFLVGTTYSSNGNIATSTQNGDGLLIKTTTNGDFEWSKTYGGIKLDEIRQIISLQDGNFLLVGNTHSDDFPINTIKKGYADIFALKIDVNGTPIWQKRFGGDRSDQVFDAVEQDNELVLLVGSTFSRNGDFSSSLGHSDGFVLALNANGDKIWVKQFGNETTNEFKSIIPSLDGNFILTGYTGIIDYTATGVKQDYDENAWLFKMDTNGNEIWSKNYGGTRQERATKSIVTLDGGLLMSASSSSFDGDITTNKGKSDVWIVKTDANGSIEWQRNYGGNASDFGKAVLQTNDGSYYLAAETMSSNEDIAWRKGSIDTWLIKLEGTYQLGVNLGADQSICAGQSLTLNPSTACTDCSYLWNDGSSAPTLLVNPTINTTYSLTITDGTGLSATDQITISINPDLEANLTAINNSCFGGNDGSINVNPLSGNAPYTYQWSNGNSDATINNLAIGNYQLTLTDNNGCTGTFSTSIEQPDILAITAQPQDIACFGEASGSINTQISGGTSPYSYAWNTGQTSATINELSIGVYTLTVTDANNCTSEYTTTLNEPNALSTSGNSSDLSCFDAQDGAINIQSSGGISPYTYTWSTGQSSAMINNLPEGNYQLTTTDANNCTSIFSTIINAPSELSLAGTISNPSCFDASNGAIQIQMDGGTPPYTYTWDNGATAATLNNLSEGNYRLTVTDANDCAITYAATLSAPNELILTSDTNDLSCSEAQDGSISTQISGGSAPYTYTWSTGQTTASVNNLNEGNYQLTVTDVNGCTLEYSTVINAPNLLTINGDSTNPTCFDAENGTINVQINGGTLPYSYLWSNDATSAAIQNLEEGTYELTVTDANNCIQIYTTEIIAPLELEVASNFTNNDCFDTANGAIQTQVNGGTSPYSYLWDNGATTASINNLAEGTFSVTITDANNCTITSQTDITAPSELEVDLSVDEIRCADDTDGVLIANVTGGTSGYTFEWSTGETTSFITGLAAGMYALTVSDANSCSTIISTTLETPEAISSSISGFDVTCHGMADGQLQISANGGTPPYAYNWSNGETDTLLNFLFAGDYEYTITDANGCTKEGITSVNEPDPININGSSFNVLCFGNFDGQINTDVMGGNPPYDYQWSTMATESNLMNLTVGAYTLTITDANLCSQTENYIVNTPDSLSYTSEIILPNDNSANGSISITVNGGIPPYQYFWENDEVSSTIENLASGTYQVTVLDANDCVLTASFDLMTTSTTNVDDSSLFTIYPNPTVNYVFIENIIGNSNPIEIKLYNLLGQLLLEESFSNPQDKVQLPLDEYSTGTYFILLQQDEHSQLEKIIIIE